MASYSRDTSQENQPKVFIGIKFCRDMCPDSFWNQTVGNYFPQVNFLAMQGVEKEKP